MQNYGGDAGWDRFLTELATLPAELSVIGINDYLFIDGYRRVLDEWQQGRLPNIEAVFPVIEFRLRELAGVDGEIKRINYHAIFAPGLDPNTIEAQFLNGLAAKFHLSEDGGPAWSAFLSRENVIEFGRQLRAHIPAPRQSQLPTSDLELGFAHLVVPLDDLRRCLDHTAIAGQSLCAIGKTEWSSLRWGDQSIATKKDLINGADLVFTAAATPAAYGASRRSLREQGVNDRLLDCSDAHHFTDSPEKDRLGNSMTWVRAQPTLAGLRHAVAEFDTRVFVGDEPKKLGALRSHPGAHVKRVVLRKSNDAPSDAATLFDTSLDLNPGFVAVVGNKGKGKSALLDVIGLAGDSSAEASFTFLSPERFRNTRANRAAEHAVSMTWWDGGAVDRRLDRSVPDGAPERITYLPQQLLDEICSPEPGEPAEKFARQLGQVLFAHVPPADRLGASNLDALISTRGQAIDERLTDLRSDLSILNAQIALQQRLFTPARRPALAPRITLIRRNHDALAGQEPNIPAKPDGSDPALQVKVDGIRQELARCDEEIEAQRQRDAALALELDAAEQLATALQTLDQHITAFRSSHRAQAVALGLSIDDLVVVSLDQTVLDDAVAQRKSDRESLQLLLDPSNASGPVHRKAQLQSELAEAVALMDQPERDYAAAVREHEAWKLACDELLHGSADEPGIDTTQAELDAIERTPADIGRMRSERDDLVRRVHEALGRKVAIFEDLYQPACAFIEEHPLARACELAFGASLRERSLEDRFFGLVSRGVAGTFTGVEEGSEVLRERVAATDFSDAESVVSFANAICDALHQDQRSTPATSVDAERAVRVGHTIENVYDLLFGLSYLEPHHSLRYQGLQIDQLSPGEKGTLLLMFYLLVDPGRTPLLLDQPDENLDNHTIKDLLVPAIKEAADRRQVIVVTHNPNVAIVADADQVVVADREGDLFTYRSGAIEDGGINLSAVDVLEGTWPALDNRTLKYQRPTGPG